MMVKFCYLFPLQALAFRKTNSQMAEGEHGKIDQLS